MGAVSRMFYYYVMRKNSTFWPFVVVSAFVAERIVDSSSESIFDSYNKGKLFKDVVKQN